MPLHTLLICEVAARQRKHRLQRVIAIVCRNGFYKEYLVSLTKKGIEGLQEISQMMVDLRNFKRNQRSTSYIW
jgi:hypothetical protein